MKLRFRANSLRLRLNRSEVEALANGKRLEERITFPNADLIYAIEPIQAALPHASFHNSSIQVLVPLGEVKPWAAGDEIGLYFHLETGSQQLRVMVEKDLECVDGPAEERDPDAFQRVAPVHC